MSSDRRFEIRWGPIAAKDVRDFVTYLERDYPSRASAFLTRLATAVDRLQDQPALGRVVPELHRMGIDSYRELIIQPYRVLYRIDGSRVFITAVCDSRRNVQDVLLEHLIRFEP